MAKEQENPVPELSVESVSAVFAHDISTPLTTAQMNNNLLIEYANVLESALKSKESEDIPAHIRIALEKAPLLIQSNLDNIQRALKEFKSYLNALHGENLESGSRFLPEITPLTQGRRLKILLVDDEDIHHDIGEAVLSSDHEVAHENSGTAAIARCKKESFDVILMDMQMPVMPGPQTTETLRTFVNNNTLIIGLSNMPIQSKKTELIECGFNDFLDKPLKLGAFNKMVESLTKT